MITLRDIPHCSEVHVVEPVRFEHGRWAGGWARTRHICHYTDREGVRYEVGAWAPRAARLAVHKKAVLVELQRRFWATKALSAEEAHLLQVIRKFVRKHRALLAL